MNNKAAPQTGPEKTKPTKPEPDNRQDQPTRSGKTDQSGQKPVQGRKPLFRA